MSPPPERRRICLVAAVPMTFNAFLTAHVASLRSGYSVTLVSSGSRDELHAGRDPSVGVHQVRIARGIDPIVDLVALWRLFRYFRRERFDLVQSITPKAGLLTMVAGRAAGVPRRVHWFTGQVWATRQGFARASLRMMDKLLAGSATHLLADSASQRQFLEAEGIVRPTTVEVLGAGSVNGVDVGRFKPDPAARARVRASLGIPDDAVVLLFMGRLHADKGLRELADAFARLASDRPRLHLLLVGVDESGVRPALAPTLSAVHERVHYRDHTSEPQAFMAASDVLVIPSYREGFGSVVIEAAACGLPAVGSRIYGLTDAIEDGVSGLLVPVRDAAALAEALAALADSTAAREQMGAQARQRALELFPESRLTAALMAFYERILPA